MASDDRPLAHGRSRRGSQLRGALVLALGLAGLLGIEAQAYTGTTTGTTPNFCLPTNDSFDWGDCYNSNWQVIGSSFPALVTSIGSSTQAIADANASISALQSVDTAIIARQDAAAISTTTIDGDLTNEVSRAMASENSIANSTGSIYAALNSTASALTTETAARASADSVLTSAVNSTGSAVTTLTSVVSGKAPLTGGGTSGTWGINVTGTAGSLVAGSGISSGCAAGYYLSTMTVTNGVITGGGCILAGGGGAGHTIAIGTLTAGATDYPSRSLLTFDSNYFTAVDSATQNSTFISLSSGPGTGMTRQIFLSGSGTYTTPPGVVKVSVKMVGGGGGGGAVNTNDGTAGNFSQFGSTVAAGGAKGVKGPGGTGGAGGTSGASSSAVLRIAGGSGGASVGGSPGAGGQSSLGGGAGVVLASTSGRAAAANSGSGGGGGAGVSDMGGGGAAGETAEFVIASPAGNYPFVVGASAPGGVSTGGAGGSGIIIIDEYYH